MSPPYLPAAVLLTVAALTATGQQPPPKPLTTAQMVKLKERNKFDREAADFAKAGKLAEAAAATERSLAIERKVFGDAHPDVAVSLGRLGALWLRSEDWARARTAFKALLDVQIALYGKDDWGVTDTRFALANADLFENLPREDRLACQRADRSNVEGQRSFQQGQFTDAITHFREAIEIWRGCSETPTRIPSRLAATSAWFTEKWVDMQTPSF